MKAMIIGGGIGGVAAAGALQRAGVKCDIFEQAEELREVGAALSDFLRQAVLPQAVRHWTLRTLREKLIKTGAKVVRHSRKIVFQMAEVAVPRVLFQTILERIGRLRLATAMSG